MKKFGVLSLIIASLIGGLYEMVQIPTFDNPKTIIHAINKNISNEASTDHTVLFHIIVVIRTR